MANDTGGRLTKGTNDLSLGYARAQRDLGCRYTVGFYVNRLKEDNPRMIRLRVKGEGLEVRYPGQYKAQSPEKLKSTRLMAAFLQPEMFHSDFLRVYLFLLQPRSPEEWDALVAVNFPVSFHDPENPAYEGDFGVIVTSGPRGTHHFNRNVSIRPKAGVSLDERRFTFLEPLVITPGTYSISTVVSEAGQDGPAAVRTTVDVPEVPWQDLTLVPPILGRPRERNIVVRGDGPESNRDQYSSDELAQYDIQAGMGTFEPLLVLQTRETETLLSRNKACLVGAKRTDLPAGTTVDRSLKPEDGEPMEMTPLPLVLDKGAKVRCRNLFETLREKAAGEGQYIYKVVIDESKKFGEKKHRLPLAIKEVPEKD